MPVQGCEWQREEGPLLGGGGWRGGEAQRVAQVRSREEEAWGSRPLEEQELTREAGAGQALGQDLRGQREV